MTKPAFRLCIEKLSITQQNVSVDQRTSLFLGIRKKAFNFCCCASLGVVIGRYYDNEDNIKERFEARENFDSLRKLLPALITDYLRRG